MTKKQLERYHYLYSALERAGFDADETDRLLKIEHTLHRWSEEECNGTIERDPDDVSPKHPDGQPYRSFAAWGGKHNAYKVADREAGALRRLAQLMEGHPEYVAYHQGDPRGCALYLVKRSEVPEGGRLDSYYARGLAVCI